MEELSSCQQQICILWGFLWGFSFDNVQNISIELIVKYIF